MNTFILHWLVMFAHIHTITCFKNIYFTYSLRKVCVLLYIGVDEQVKIPRAFKVIYFSCVSCIGGDWHVF